MRIPGTLNYKYPGAPRAVRVIAASGLSYKDLGLKAPTEPEEAPEVENWVPTPAGPPRELWASVKASLPRKVSTQYDKRAQGPEGRSGALWALTLALFRAGHDRNVVWWLAKHSANNKFGENRYHADEDLAKDVLRAERHLRTQSGSDDIKSKILEARRLPGLASERRAYISALVRDSLSQQGSFVSTTDGQEWFVREDTGRPIPLTRQNDQLNSVLELRYGLNATEPEQRFVVANLIAHTKERGRQGITAALSHFDIDEQRLLVHTGRRDVYLVDRQSVSVLANGNLGVVFPWGTGTEPFDPEVHSELSIDYLFDGCFDNLDEIEPNEAMALLKAWLHFTLFRSAATARPLLALFGQPGSGKSTLFRRIYALIYGGGKALSTITSADNFDHVVANDPLVLFDGVDSWASWLPDKLSLAAASSDLVKRKLYTDNDVVVLKRQAMVGISAHNPKFRREDIVDRLLMLNFHRLPVHKDETEIISRIALNRDFLWGSLIHNCQAILATPMPQQSEVPKFRVSDFARLGLWIARALGFEADFRAALKSNAKEQTSLNLEEEDTLVDTIQIWLTSGRVKPGFYSIADLWDEWSLLARDNASFTRAYRNTLGLSRKLWALQETLSQVFEVEYQLDESKGIRLWRFAIK